MSRKDFPVYSGVIKYFPDAILEVARVSKVGNEQHNPGQPLHWNRALSTDEPDALMRHLIQAGTVDTDGVRHTAKVAWRSLSLLQKELEASLVIEEFRDIPGWEGYYQVSNYGNVKSLARKYSPNESILTPTLSFDGYLKVSLRNRKIHKQEEVNRLVALAFIDKDYISKKLVCDHIDRDKTNNNLTNLRVVSFRENSSNNGKSKLAGAFKKGKSYQSAISVNNKVVYLGTFKTELEAHNKYLETLKALASLQRELDNERKDIPKTQG